MTGRKPDEELISSRRLVTGSERRVLPAAHQWEGRNGHVADRQPFPPTPGEISASAFGASSLAQIVALMDPRPTAHTITCSFGCRVWGGQAASPREINASVCCLFEPGACRMMPVTAEWRCFTCFPSGNRFPVFWLLQSINYLDD